uniref:Cul o 2 allergen n=1 Tax=Culicoides obsoletus TaxID=289301 RepID=K9P1W5_CULOB|nr:Cul o 2 allergen [Culicoides obsoletus]
MTTFKTFIVLLSIALSSLVDAGTPGTTRCEKKNKLSKETIDTYHSWRMPTSFRTKAESCHLHCVLEKIGWMKGHKILDKEINSDIKASKESPEARSSHLRTLLFEDCNIRENNKKDKCKKARDVYKCLVEKFEPRSTFQKAFERAEKRSEK